VEVLSTTRGGVSEVSIIGLDVAMLADLIEEEEMARGAARIRGPQPGRAFRQNAFGAAVLSVVQ
jgi:hypothetical protein